MRTVGRRANDYELGWKDAAAPQPCGHVRANLVDERCTACAREKKIISTARATIKAELVAVIKTTAAGVVPKATVDWLDGVRHGADLVVAAVEES